MKKILAAKLAARKLNANLPIEDKLTMMERMRDRSRMIAGNSLRWRHSAMPFLVVAGDGVVLSGLVSKRLALTPPVVRQYSNQPNTLQNAETLIVETR